MKTKNLLTAIAVAAVGLLSSCNKMASEDWVAVPVVQVKPDAQIEPSALIDMLEEAILKAGFPADTYLPLKAKDAKDAAAKINLAPEVVALESALKQMAISGYFSVIGAKSSEIASGDYTLMSELYNCKLGNPDNSDEYTIKFFPTAMQFLNAEGMEAIIYTYTNNRQGREVSRINVPYDNYFVNCTVAGMRYDYKYIISLGEKSFICELKRDVITPLVSIGCY